MVTRLSRAGLLSCAIYAAIAGALQLFGHLVVDDPKGSYALNQASVLPGLYLAIGTGLADATRDTPWLNNFFSYFLLSLALAYGVGWGVQALKAPGLRVALLWTTAGILLLVLVLLVIPVPRWAGAAPRRWSLCHLCPCRSVAACSKRGWTGLWQSLGASRSSAALTGPSCMRASASNTGTRSRHAYRLTWLSRLDEPASAAASPCTRSSRRSWLCGWERLPSAVAGCWSCPWPSLRWSRRKRA